MGRPWNIPVYWGSLSERVRAALMADDLNGLTVVDVAALQKSEVLDEDGALTEFGRKVGQFGKDMREMARLKLKVWSWQGWRQECPPARNGGKQTSEVVAAKSMAAAARAAGVKRPAQLFNLGRTGNDEQIAAAMAEPGVVFWRPLDGREKFIRGKEQP